MTPASSVDVDRVLSLARRVGLVRPLTSINDLAKAPMLAERIGWLNLINPKFQGALQMAFDLKFDYPDHWVVANLLVRLERLEDGDNMVGFRWRRYWDSKPIEKICYSDPTDRDPKINPNFEWKPGWSIPHHWLPEYKGEGGLIPGVPNNTNPPRSNRGPDASQMSGPKERPPEHPLFPMGRWENHFYLRKYRVHPRNRDEPAREGFRKLTLCGVDRPVKPVFELENDRHIRQGSM